MKKLVTGTILVCVITLMSGCLTTLHPLFTEKDLVYDARLAGTWQVNKEGETIIFEKGPAAAEGSLPDALQQVAEKAYIVTVKGKEGDIEQKYYGFLTRLGKELYMDYYPIGTPKQKGYDPAYVQHFVKMHSFYRFRFRSDRSFETSQLKEDFLKDLINKKQIRIRHEVRFDGSYVITAPTEELQQYVLKYTNVPEAYESSETYTKIN